MTKSQLAAWMVDNPCSKVLFLIPKHEPALEINMRMEIIQALSAQGLLRAKESTHLGTAEHKIHISTNSHTWFLLFILLDTPEQLAGYCGTNILCVLHPDLTPEQVQLAQRVSALHYTMVRYTP